MINFKIKTIYKLLMKEDEKDKMEDKNTGNKINEEENNEDFLQIDNLNINNEVDIKENPKKHIANAKKAYFKKCIRC